MSYQVPNGWSFYGAKEDQTTFALPGHTPTAPFLAIFDRKAPTVSSGGVSVPTYRVRVFHGVVDTDGNPVVTRPLVDTSVRWPNGSDPVTTKGLLTIVGTMFLDTEFQKAVVDMQLLPTSVAGA